MITREHLAVWTVLFTMMCISSAWAAPEPRLSEDDVAKMADDKVREAGYSPETYFHGAPMYVERSGVWEVHYDHRAKQGQGASRAFTVGVDDATGFTSLNFSHPALAATPPATVNLRAIIQAIAVGLLIGGLLRLLAWLRGRRSHARSDAKA